MIEKINDSSYKCDIFISYKRQFGEELAQQLYDKLRHCGYSVFLDSKQLDDVDYVEEIENRIEQCTDFIVLFTQGSLDKILNEKRTNTDIQNEDWLAKEIRLAQKHNAHIIPIIKEGFRAPEGLPKDIEKATHINGVYVPMQYFDEAFMRLINVFLNCKQNYNAMDSDTETRRKAKSGDPCYMNDFALKTEIGTAMIYENKASSLRQYINAAENGSAAAYYNIGDIFEKCAEDLHLSGKSEYNVDEQFLFVTEEDLKADPTSGKEEILRKRFIDEAKKNYIKAGDKYPPALYRLGVLAEKEYRQKEAFEYYRKAQEQCYAPAVNAVGYFYENGIGDVTRNSEKALELFKSVSDKLPHAAYNYARLLSRSVEDITRDVIEEYYKFAFFNREPVPQAAFALAELYKKEGNYIVARHFYYLALDSGYYPAGKAIKELDIKYGTSRYN